MKGKVIFAVIALALILGVMWLVRPLMQPGEDAFIAGRRVTVWSRVAQVREPVVELSHGDRVEVVERKGDNARIRTRDGRTGWIEERHLVNPSVWDRGGELLEQARGMTEQARGRTRVAANVRVEPGRGSPRIFQFRRGTRVAVLGRGVADWSPEDGEPSEAVASRRMEDWSFVVGFTDDADEVAGWILSRFVEYDLPVELRDYAAGLRFIAWFEMNRVRDGIEERPQYLALGTKGPEGQPCDFTMLRVYTWNSARIGYETAYLESDICGWLPVHVEQQAAQTTFRLRAEGRKGPEERTYRMSGTIVRRISTSPIH